MLTNLRIKNLALVEDLSLELRPGFNVVTGETGAGKSILIGALNGGLIGFFDNNLVGNMFGGGVARIIYALVGVCALYEILAWRPVHASLAPGVKAAPRV